LQSGLVSSAQIDFTPQPAEEGGPLFFVEFSPENLPRQRGLFSSAKIDFTPNNQPQHLGLCSSANIDFTPTTSRGKEAFALR
jgi:hypothetical protein